MEFWSKIKKDLNEAGETQAHHCIRNALPLAPKK